MPSPLPLLFFFLIVFLVDYIGSRSRAEHKSLLLLSSRSVAGNGESGVEGSGGTKLFHLLFLSLLKAGGHWWQRWWVTFPCSQEIPLQIDHWDFCHWLQLRPIMRERESKKISRMIWKVWGELQDKGRKVAKVGNVIIKLSDTGNTYVVGKKARGHAQLSLDKMFYSFLTLFSCWNYLPRPTIDTARLPACWILSFKLMCLLMSHE